jgi:carboxypeptidase T
MNKRVGLLLLLAVAACEARPEHAVGGTSVALAALQSAGAGPWVVRASFRDRAALAALAAEHPPWEVDQQAKVAVIEVADLRAAAALERAGYGLALDEVRTKELTSPPRAPTALAGIPGYPCYRTVEETFATAQALAASRPTLAAWLDIGDSWDKWSGAAPGYDLRVLKLTNTAIPGPKPVMFVMAAVHAREYVTAETLTRFAEYLVNNYNIDADATWLLDHQEFHFLLQSNPDGRKYAEAGSSWRKNTDQNYCGTTSSSRGADLNRNFPFLWGGGGSSGSPCSLTYRGVSPSSEPETQAITQYVRSIFPDQRDESAGLGAPAPANATGIFMDLHSYSQLVLWPWSFGSAVAPNNTALRTLGRKLAYFNGYQPQQSIELYPADGVTIDFAYGELGVASYVFEMGTSFFQSCSSFESTIYPTNLQALRFAAKAARTPYLTPAGPESLPVTLSASTVPRGTAVTVSAVLNDTRFSSANGAEPVQLVAAAELYVDVPPWAPGATALAMSAADGSFNQTVETARATLATAGLSVGRHALYVRGRDAAGSWGSVSAAFVTVQAAANGLPAVAISQPKKGTVVVAGGAVTLTASASDGEDGDLTASIVWTSNLSGAVAVGGNASVVLPPGTHILTAAVTDSQGATATATATVTVGGISALP